MVNTSEPSLMGKARAQGVAHMFCIEKLPGQPLASPGRAGGNSRLSEIREPLPVSVDSDGWAKWTDDLMCCKTAA